MVEKQSDDQDQVGAGLHAVFVASADVLASWSARTLPTAQLTTFSDIDLESALESILRQQPSAVVVEESLAATIPGQGFVRRLQTAPSLPGLDIRLIAAETIAALVPSPESAADASGLLVGLAEPLPTGPQRRAARLKVPAGIKLVVDGTATMLVEFSVAGALIISPVAFRPKQQVRITLPEEEHAAKLSARIVWSAFELPKSGTVPTFYDQARLDEPLDGTITLRKFGTAHYRVGIEFIGTDPQVLETFGTRLRQLAADLGTETKE